MKLPDARRLAYCVRCGRCGITNAVIAAADFFASLAGAVCRRAVPITLVVFCAGSWAGQLHSPHTTSHLLAPSDLRCNGWNEPLAVADAQPQFSWSLSASSPTLHNVKQSAYQIEVAATPGNLAAAQNLLWDSGIIHSAAASGVVYQGSSLQQQHEYAWRVRVWDEQDHPSAWSAAAYWSQAPAWHADWIEAPNASDPGTPLPLFRKSFALDRPVVRAIVYASGLGQDELHINGRRVGNALLTPGWSDYRKTTFYDSYDVTSLLHSGQNVLGVMLGNGMYRVLHTPGRYTKFVGSFGAPKCIVQLEIQLAGDKTIEIESNGTWKSASGPITFSSTYGGEDYDARRDPQGWDRAGFDDSSWQSAVETDSPGGALTPELAPPIRVMHVYSPIRITHPAPGVTVYDFGQNFAGWPAITVSGRAGAVLKLIPGELLDQHGLVSQRSSGGPQWFSYTLRGGGQESWHPRFSYYGFRYLEVQGATAQAGVRLLKVQGDAIHSSSAQVGKFASSDTLLNRIHTLILRAIENNAVSIFTDCPHREKLGWLEETHLMAPSMLYDFNFAHLYAATARNIADTQKTEGPKAGMVPEIAPQYVVFDPQKYDVFNDSPEWGSAAVLAPWYVYQRDGKLQFLADQFDVMRRYVAYLGTRAQDGIIDYGLGDWYDIGLGAPGISKLTSPGVTATAIYYQDLKVLEKTAALLGKNAESSKYEQEAEQVRQAFNERFFHPAQHIYDKGSQTAQAMPLVLGMVPADQRSAVFDALVADIRQHQNHTTAGDIGFHYVVDALMEGGRSDVLLDMLSRTDTPSYGSQLAQGATSLTEAWDANPASSQDHLMLGDAEEWFYRGLGGIDVDLARHDLQQIFLKPAVLSPIRWVRTQYQSALGLIRSNWQRGPEQAVYEFDIPANATATIVIATGDPRSVTVNGAEPSRAPGELSTSFSENSLTVVVGSGHYQIRAADPRIK